MDYYQDINILPDPEFATPILMNALFSKLHRALVALDSKEIGVSFPEVVNNKCTLGKLLRLHGNASALQSLEEKAWLAGMRDLTDVKEISPIPNQRQYCRITRVQVKSSAQRLRKRYTKRHEGVTEQDAMELIPDSVEKRLSLPYLQLRSVSTGQRFLLFIDHGHPQPEAVAGEFNCYGLSNNATVPWF